MSTRPSHLAITCDISFRHCACLFFGLRVNGSLSVVILSCYQNIVHTFSSFDNNRIQGWLISKKKLVYAEHRKNIRPYASCQMSLFDKED